MYPGTSPVLLCHWLANENTSDLSDLPLTIANHRHSLFSHICRLSLTWSTCTSSSSSALTPLVASFEHRAVEDADLADHIERGWSKWRKTWGNLWAQLRSPLWIGQYGGHNEVMNQWPLAGHSQQWVINIAARPKDNLPVHHTFKLAASVLLLFYLLWVKTE